MKTGKCFFCNSEITEGDLGRECMGKKECVACSIKRIKKEKVINEI